MAMETNFTVQLWAKSWSESFSLQWYCRSHEACTYSMPELTSSCAKSTFRNIAEMDDNLVYLHDAYCHEVWLEDAESFLDGGACVGQAKCPAVIYRHHNVGNGIATCPSGTEMVLQMTSSPKHAYSSSDRSEIWVRTERPEVVLTNEVDLVDDCSFSTDSAETLVCTPGNWLMRFTDSAAACYSSIANCPHSPGVNSFGVCGGACRGMPAVLPGATVFDTYFAVRVYVLQEARLDLSARWQCLSTPTCSSTAPIEWSDACSFHQSSFQTPPLADVIEVAHESHACQLIQVENITAACENEDHQQCATILYHRNGSPNVAACPGGTEMQLFIAGAVTSSFATSSFNHFFVSMPANVGVIGGMPDDCLLIGGWYRCPVGSMRLRLSQRGPLSCDTNDPSTACPRPLSGELRGLCPSSDGNITCAKPPSPPNASSNTNDFSVHVTTGHYSSLTWQCRTSSTCTYTAETSLRLKCRQSIFRDRHQMVERLPEYAYSRYFECDEVFVMNQDAECQNSCHQVYYHTNRGISFSFNRDVIPTCPAGTEMIITVGGIEGPAAFSPVGEFVKLNGDLPGHCTVHPDGEYLCEKGPATIRFTLRGDLACDAEEGICADVLPRGDPYGNCPGSKKSCLALPPPSRRVPRNARVFSVQVGSNNVGEGFEPSIQWYCRSAFPCTYRPESGLDACEVSIFEGNAQLDKYLTQLGSGCQQIIVQDGSQILGNTCVGNHCPAILFRYSKVEHSNAAICPAGTEMVLKMYGPPSPSIEYSFGGFVDGESHSNGKIRPVTVIGGLPDGCFLLHGNYRCPSGTVTLRFTLHSEDFACDSTSFASCPTMPAGGIPYGLCPPDPECSSGIPIEAALPTSEFNVQLKLPVQGPPYPSMTWLCQVDEFCFASPDSIASSCSSQAFNSTIEMERNFASLPDQCNKMLVVNGATLRPNFCPTEAQQPCVGLIHGFPNATDPLAVCPTGSQMVLTVAGGPPSAHVQEYMFIPSPGTRVQDIPSECSQVSNRIHCPAGSMRIAFDHRSSPPCLGSKCLPPVSGSLYGQCRNGAETVCLDNFPATDLQAFNDTYAPTLLPTRMPATWPPAWDPTSFPSSLPSVEPTRKPTMDPTLQPTNFPTEFQTSMPTIAPTAVPTGSPTLLPTTSPTTTTREPSEQPSAQPMPSDTSSAIPPTSNEGFGSSNYIPTSSKPQDAPSLRSSPAPTSSAPALTTASNQMGMMVSVATVALLVLFTYYP